VVRDETRWLSVGAHVQGVRLNHAIFFSRGEAS
jgi:hypothetical protein